MAGTVGYPSHDLITSGTVSATNENATYPATNLQTTDPAEPFKSTTTATTITVTHASSARTGVSFINHNLAGATVTVGGVSVTIPARTSDGQCVNSYTTLSLSAGTSTSIVITGASAAVAIGRICLLSEVQSLAWKSDVEFEMVHPAERILTFSLSETIYDKGIRRRVLRATLPRETSRTIVEALWMGAKGGVTPFLLVPSPTVNDAWYVRFAGDAQTIVRQAPNVTEMTVEFSEVSMGLPL